MDLDYYKDLEVTGCEFYDNESGPLLSPEVGKYNAAAAIVVDGGLDHLINQNKFYGHKGNYDYHTSLQADSFKEYMPPGYFTYAMVPVIRIVINPDDPRDDIPFQTFILDNQFYKNEHVQVLGLKDATQFRGSLINYFAEVAVHNHVVPFFFFEDNKVFDNFFVGPAGSLIYVEGAVSKINRNTFTNNGLLSGTVYVKDPLRSITR